MDIRRRLALLALFAVATSSLLWSASGAPAARAAVLPWNVASESYYRLDVPAGAMAVSVDATFQNAVTNADLKAVNLWAMPRAQDVQVTQDGAVLETKLLPINDVNGAPTRVIATLAAPLKPNTRTKLQMTYAVPAQTSELVRIEAGATEARFVSQGAGSFTFIDVPMSGDNFFEPGCLRTAEQPKDVAAAGFERWVCGEATLIAIGTENKDLQAKCARADDSCRQRYDESPFAAFAQSITDTTKRGRLEADIPLARGNVKLRLLYFRTDEAWAQRQFAAAKAALPKLEEAFGFPYPRDTVLLRESHFLENVGALGIAFTEDGDMLISNVEVPGLSAEEVTVHELAHQWAGRNLETSWLWEGLAEYGMRTVAPSLNIRPYDRKWESFGFKDLLGNWFNGSPVRNPDYWYGKAGAFWFEYQKTIGGQVNMTRVLALMDDDPKKWPLGGRWFMDRGEDVSGVNLDDLYLKWVWTPDTAKSLLEERRAARELAKTLYARALTFNLIGQPADIQANLDGWEFRAVSAQVGKANEVLDNYQRVLEYGQKNALPQSDAVAKVWATNTTTQTAALIADQRNAIDAITSAAARLKDAPPDSPSLKQLDEARAKYAAGDIAEAKRLAGSSTTSAFNQQAATKMLELARAEHASFSASFFGRIGLMFQDPAADLAAAETSYAGGDYAAAFKQSRAALDAWNNADASGLKRLAALAGLMSVLTVGAWWLIRKLDLGGGSPSGRSPVARGPGHTLPSADDRRGTWRDWENTK